MKRNRLLRIIIISVLSALLFLLFVPLLLNIVFKINFGIWSLKSEWTAGDALNFYGSVLSGLLTLVGVLLTISYEAKGRKKDDTIKYKPILEVVGINMPISCACREVGFGYGISGSSSDENTEESMEIFFNQQHENNPKYRLFIRNAGRGETYNAILENCFVKSVNWKDISNLQSNISSGQYIGEIIKDGYFEICVNLPDYLILPRTLGSQKWLEILMEINIDYSDMFNRIRYRYSLLINQKLHTDTIETKSPYISDDNYCYAKVKYDDPEVMPNKQVYSSVHKKFISERDFLNEKEKIHL